MYCEEKFRVNIEYQSVTLLSYSVRCQNYFLLPVNATLRRYTSLDNLFIGKYMHGEQIVRINIELFDPLTQAFSEVITWCQFHMVTIDKYPLGIAYLNILVVLRPIFLLHYFPT